MTTCFYWQVNPRFIAFARAVGARVMRIIEPTSANEDRRRQEYILNIILAISFIFLCALECTILWNYFVLDDYGGLSPLNFGGIIILCLVLFFASKNGYARIVSYVLIALYAIGTIYGGWIWGMSLPPILLATALVIVTSSVLIGSSFGFVSAIIMICVLILLGIHEKSALNIPEWHYREISYTDMITYAIMFAFISFIAWLSSREITKSLHRARTSEGLLAKERDSLEERISERTKAFIDTEQDRIRQLEETSRFGNLSQGLFHDLMNPLSSISLYTERLSKDHALSKETYDAVQKIIQVSKNMGSYMQSLRHYIRMNRCDHIDGTADIRAEMEMLRDIFGFKARMLNVQLNFDIPNEPLTIRAHPIRVHQLFSNLISNSLESCERMTTIQSGRQHIFHMSAVKDGQSIIVRVKDTGCGITPNTLCTISKKSCTTKVNGLGMGLVTVRQIVEDDLGGSMTITSTEGKGATFTITIPSNKHDRKEKTSVTSEKSIPETGFTLP